MQKDEQLRRRDPMKYAAAMEQRRRENLSKVLQATQGPTASGLPHALTTGIDLTREDHNRSEPESPPGTSTVLLASRLRVTNNDNSACMVSSLETRIGSMPPPGSSNNCVRPSSSVDRSASTPTSIVQATPEADRVSSSLVVHNRSSSAGPSAFATSMPATAAEDTEKQLLDRQLLIPDPSPIAAEPDEGIILYALSEAVDSIFFHTDD